MERRIFRIGIGLTLIGGLLVWALGSSRQGFSLFAGGGLAAANLAWLRGTVGAIMLQEPKRSKQRVLAAFFARLLLIPLCLYAMIRFLFLSPVAVVAGFALFYCSVLIEGILEAAGSTPK